MHSGIDYWKNYMEKWFGADLIEKWKSYAVVEPIMSNGREIQLEVYENSDRTAPTIVFAHGIAGYARILLPFGLSGGYVQDHFLESMAEAAKAIADDAGENILYINIMNNISVDCDCDSNPAKPEMDDIGILASLDPVALDKACVDQVYASDKEKSANLRRRIEFKHGTHTLDYAEEIGLGMQRYKLVVIDD